jgi:drug/metabolite transporter (DMT)-like permease
MDFSAVHLHLAINHSPLYGELFALCLVIFGLIKKRREFVTAGLVVCIIAALCGIAADMTGDSAAHFVSHANPPIAGLDKTLIKEHDQAATFLVGGSCITAFVAIVALFIGHRRGTRPRWLEVVIAILIAWSLAIAGRTALLGGRIHHEEVRALAIR